MAGSLPLALDMVLALMLVVIGLGVLVSRDLFQSIVLFIIFGMFLGIAWCRLDAVDVALAEMAIGAGVTGALLLSTLYVTRRDETQAKWDHPLHTEEKSPRARIARACAAVFFVTVLVVGLAMFVVPLAHVSTAPGGALNEALPRSGVSNPVTAVLLNFRAYDTLLEVTVLLAAVLAALVLSTNAPRAEGPPPVGPVLGTFVRLLFPLAILVGVYLLWVGTKAPGGAFQSAAILGAVGVLMIVCGARPPTFALRRWRVLLAGGPGLFLLVGIGGVAAGGNFLELPPRWAGRLIMLVETSLAASTALVLVLLFSDVSPRQDENGAVVGESEAGAADARQEPAP